MILSTPPDTRRCACAAIFGILLCLREGNPSNCTLVVHDHTLQLVQERALQIVTFELTLQLFVCNGSCRRPQPVLQTCRTSVWRGDPAGVRHALCDYCLCHWLNEAFSSESQRVPVVGCALLLCSSCSLPRAHTCCWVCTSCYVPRAARGTLFSLSFCGENWLRNVCLRLCDTRRVCPRRSSPKWSPQFVSANGRPPKMVGFFSLCQNMVNKWSVAAVKKMVAPMVDCFLASLKMVALSKIVVAHRFPRKTVSVFRCVKKMTAVSRCMSVSPCPSVSVCACRCLSVFVCLPAQTHTPEKDAVASRHGEQKEKSVRRPCQVGHFWRNTF